MNEETKERSDGATTFDINRFPPTDHDPPRWKAEVLSDEKWVEAEIYYHDEREVRFLRARSGQWRPGCFHPNIAASHLRPPRDPDETVKVLMSREQAEQEGYSIVSDDPVDAKPLSPEIIALLKPLNDLRETVRTLLSRQPPPVI